jgi:diaminopimelate epimerase
MNQRFAKYHGLGNDFLVLSRLDGGSLLAGGEVRRLCDRHTGVGADGVLSLWPDGEARVRMQVQNADGSESEMCGNGLRCVARFLYDEGIAPESDRLLPIRAGTKTYPVERLGRDRFRVGMGAAVVRHADLPAPRADGTVEIEAAGRRFTATALHFGNPHAIIFTDEEPRPLAERFGPSLERDASFPRKVNVSFVQRRPSGFAAVVFERGVGITQACGSGASAIGAAAVSRGLWPRGKDMRIALPGGELVVAVDARDQVTMEGAAERVYAGEVELS